MSEVINLSERRTSACSRQEQLAELLGRAVASFDLYHEPIPRLTRIKRWMRREPSLGADFEDRLAATISERTNQGNQDAEVIKFEIDKEE